MTKMTRTKLVLVKTNAKRAEGRPVRGETESIVGRALAHGDISNMLISRRSRF